MFEMELKRVGLIDISEDEVLERIIDNSKETNNGDMTYTVLDINDILECLQNDPQSFIRNLEKKRDEMCNTYDLCEICGLEKEFIVSEGAEEYQSQPIGTTRCPNDCQA